MTLAGRLYVKAVVLAQEALATVTAIAEFTHGALAALGNAVLGTVCDAGCADDRTPCGHAPESGEIPTAPRCGYCNDLGGVRVPCAGCAKVGP